MESKVITCMRVEGSLGTRIQKHQKLLCTLKIWPIKIVSVYRGKVVKTTNETESIVYWDIDLAEVDEVRSQIPVSSQKRWDLYSITDKTQD